LKKLILLLLIVPMVSFGQIETAVMTFDETVKNFNMIGDVAKAVFPYKNTRDSSLRIVDVEGSRNSIFITNQRETVRKTRTRETSVRVKKNYGKGRIFYSSIGHYLTDFDVPELMTIQM